MAVESEGQSQPLLPGIPNDVTLSKITPKLSWRELFLLSSVSRVWRDANRSRQVYNARVHEDSADTLVLIDYPHVKSIANSTSSRKRKPVQGDGESSKKGARRCGRRAGRGAGDRGIWYPAAEEASRPWYGVALYSMRDGSCYELPSIPNVAGGFPDSCQFVSLDGKLYFLGGNYSHPRDRRKVYVLDLVLQGQWQQCANMIQQREKMVCIVMDGKIFVFGGSHHLGAEVYNPKEDTWSRIGSREISSRFPNRDEISFIRGLLERGGYDLAYFWGKLRVSMGLHLGNKNWLMNWLHISEIPLSFIARGKLHRMRRLSLKQYCIEVHTADETTWTSLHSFAFELFDYKFVKPTAVLWFGELFVVVSWFDEGGGTGFCFIQSEGFGRTDEICWGRGFSPWTGFDPSSTKMWALNSSFFDSFVGISSLKL